MFSAAILWKVWNSCKLTVSFSPWNSHLILFNTLIQDHLQNCHLSHWRLLSSCRLWYFWGINCLTHHSRLTNKHLTQPIYLLPTTPEHPLYTVQPLASEPTYSVDFFSSSTCGIALLFSPSPRAAYLYSATSGLVSFSRPARMYNPSTLPCETYGTACLPGIWVCPLFRTHCLHHPDSLTDNLHHPASIQSKFFWWKANTYYKLQIRTFTQYHLM